jgi:hypothetical protein
MNKKVFLIGCIALCSIYAVNAQDYKPEAGKFSVEAGFAPFSESPIVSDGNIMGILTLSDHFGIRLGLGFGFASASVNNGETGTETASQKVSETIFSIKPGIVYSFAGTSQLTPYIGAEIGLSSISTKQVSEVGTVMGTTTNSEGALTEALPMTAFGVGVFTGFNFYFAKNLYLGAELSLGVMSAAYKNEKTEYRGTGAPDSPAASKYKRGGLEFEIGATPVIRLGWTF